MSSTSDKAAGIGNEVLGNIKQGIGKLTGDEKMKAEGLAQEAKGEAQRATGEVKSAVKDGANKVADAANRNL